jgi:hypothetical protein
LRKFEKVLQDEVCSHLLLDEVEEEKDNQTTGKEATFSDNN